jgi:hypothetical protein
MNGGPARKRSTPPYWALLALPLLMMLPGPWATGLVIAAGLYATVGPVARAIAARRARSEALSGANQTIALGVDRAGKPVALADSQLSAHGLILGASGSGKSTTLLRILTEQIGRGAPVVAIDLKGSPAFAGRLSEAARAAGRSFHLWTPDGPGQWNPLQYGNATELKDKLIGTERFSEPHYQRAAERYLQTVLQVLEHARPGRSPTLDEVVSLMDVRRLKGALRGVPHPLADRVQDYLEELPRDQVSAVRGLASRLAILTESHTGRYLVPGASATAGTIDLRAALDGDDVVLFSLNSSSYGKLSAHIGTLVLQDLVSAAGDRLRTSAAPAAQAFVAVDEFSALGADHVLALVARGREAGFSTLLATQEFVDLDRAGPGLRDQIIGNTAVKIIHRQDVPASAQLVAQMTGTESVWEETRQIGGPWLGGYETGRGTRREVEQFVVHPNEVKTLRPGEAVVITKVPTAGVSIVGITAPRAVSAPLTTAPGAEPPEGFDATHRASAPTLPRARAIPGARPRHRTPESADPGTRGPVRSARSADEGRGLDRDSSGR